MPNITHCTFTGVDAYTNLEALASLSSVYPLIEWGFLYSPSRQGLPGRYPAIADLQLAFNTLPPNVRVALHLCGQGVPDLFAGEQVASALVAQVMARGGRVQINFNQTRNPVNLEALRRFLTAHPALTVITQHNQSNNGVWPLLADLPNHAVLFDASGGRGIEATSWPSPLQVPCGYAGGLSRDNLAKNLPLIIQAASGQPFWIDMEGSLRITDDQGRDRLSLTRCWDCIQLVNQVLAKPGDLTEGSHTFDF
jgi:phosphoribosylanthranilate isomerase